MNVSKVDFVGELGFQTGFQIGIQIVLLRACITQTAAFMQNAIEVDVIIDAKEKQIFEFPKNK